MHISEVASRNLPNNPVLYITTLFISPNIASVKV